MESGLSIWDSSSLNALVRRGCPDSRCSVADLHSQKAYENKKSTGAYVLCDSKWPGQQTVTDQLCHDRIGNLEVKGLQFHMRRTSCDISYNLRHIYHHASLQVEQKLS